MIRTRISSDAPARESDLSSLDSLNGSFSPFAFVINIAMLQIIRKSRHDAHIKREQHASTKQPHRLQDRHYLHRAQSTVQVQQVVAVRIQVCLLVFDTLVVHRDTVFLQYN